MTHPLVLLLQHVLVHDVLLLQEHLLVLLRRRLLSPIVPRRHAQLRPRHAAHSPRTRLPTPPFTRLTPYSFLSQN